MERALGQIQLTLTGVASDGDAGLERAQRQDGRQRQRHGETQPEAYTPAPWRARPSGRAFGSRRTHPGRVHAGSLNRSAWERIERMTSPPEPPSGLKLTWARSFIGSIRDRVAHIASRREETGPSATMGRPNRRPA